jgi:hypothetical protein
VSETKPERAKRKRKHREDQLDEALDQSFPASDPPSMVSPHRRPKDADD